MPNKVELTHYRLQAMLREHSFPDLEYIGERKSWKSGEMEPVSYTHLTLPTSELV